MKALFSTPLVLSVLLLLQACGSGSSDFSSGGSSVAVSSQASSQVSSAASSQTSSQVSSDASSQISSQASSANDSFPGGIAQQLPQFRVQVEDDRLIDTKEVYLNAEVVIDSRDFEPFEGAIEIRGRGNSTWGMPKKPYRLRLPSGAAASLLGMPSNRHWVLLANYADKTLMRNDVVFHLGEAMNMEYTPRSVSVDLYVNGEYQGIYQLAEHVRIGVNRVNIPELGVGDTDPDLITGGYLIEVDERRGEDFCFDSPHPQMAAQPMVFCLVNPEPLLEPDWAAHRAYIETYITDTENAIFSENFADPELGYAAYIDVDSIIAYYLINELIKNVDGNLRLSTFLYKKRNGKLTFGPLWDFDLAIGNVDYGDADLTEGWHIRTAPWFVRLFEDPAFAQQVRDRWNAMKTEGIIEGMFAHIDARALWLSEVQKPNFELWDILNIYVWPNRVVTGSYQGEVDAMKEWLQDRFEWMDAQINP